MTSAREILNQSRKAVQMKRQLTDKLEMMRSREGIKTQKYNERVSGTPDNNSMRPTEERMEAESAFAQQMATLDAYIADAQSLCDGVRKAYPLTIWSEVIERMYVKGETYEQIASALFMHRSTVAHYRDCAIDYINSVGIAAAREGIPVKAD